MDRRKFLQAGLTSVCAVYANARTSAAEPAPNPDDKLILGVPLTHSDWALKPNIAWGARGVRHMLDACKACGWSKVYWRATDGGRSLYKSALMRPQGKWDDDSFWNPQTDEDRKLLLRFTAGLTPAKRDEIRRTFDSLDYAHFDSLAAAVEYGHQIGLQIHAWVSINEDDHGWGLQSEFTKKHPEFRWRHRDGRAYRSQLSFAYPEVREYKLAILKELLDNYALDGLFLDWIRTGDVRDNPQTDAQGVADSGYEQPLIDSFKKSIGVDPHETPNGDARWVNVRAQPQTLFMRDVRKLIESRKTKLPVAVMVGHPWHYRGEGDKIDGNLRGLLLDVGAWSREGLIDSAVAAGYYRDGGTPAKAREALVKETEGMVDVWSYAWAPQNLADIDRDFSLATKTGAKQMLLWEADYIDDRANAAELKAAMAKRARW
ncbi:MAG: hypothetical protein JWN40_1559 [Phycisphaerales bacterium]|nr:hypothetical protein [Phycisphaerales bacterium]